MEWLEGFGSAIELVEMRKVEKIRLEGARTPALVKAITRHIDWLSGERKSADKDLDGAIKANSSFQEDDEILQSTQVSAKSCHGR